MMNMPAYKDSKTGTWFVKFYCKDWTGENKQIKKRGFVTKREALDYERNYKIRQENNLDMTFGEFWKLYTEDVKNYVKLNTWLTKEHIVDTKILPYFKNLKMNEITPGDVRKWQNEMVAFRNENGKSYSQTYKKTMHNILSAIFNHACRFYNLKSNPARQAGNMGREEKKEMLFWTTEEYKKFSEAVIDKPVSFYAFEMLYWTGMRLGELLALTMEDFDFEKNTVRINKSYQRLQGQDVITTPKTPKSNRTIKLPKFLAEEMQEYFAMLYDQTSTARIFLVTKSFLHHEMERGCKLSGVKKIRIHDLRHSHISHLIDLGFSAVAIADRVGHESIDITYRYSHLFPSKQVAMADRLDAVNASFVGGMKVAKKVQVHLDTILEELQTLDESDRGIDVEELLVPLKHVLEHFAKDVLGDDYEAVYAVHTDREHMHGHLIWNSESMTTGKKYNSPKSNWKNHLQPITNKYCDELGLSIMPAEYSRNPKNISKDKWEKEMSMKEIILRDAKMCAYAAGNVEHFKYLMKRLGYVFKKDAWMEVRAPGFRYYHKLAKLDEMFSEDMLRHYVDMPWMSKPYFYSSDIRGLHRAKLSPFQKKFYAKLYRLRIVEQKRFVVGGAKYTEDLKRFQRLQDEYLLLVNNDIKSVVELVDFISEKEDKIQQIEDRQKEIYRESSSRKRNIKNEEQYREYQIWHVEMQEELDELKQKKRNIKRQIQLADDIIKEDLYTAYYAVSEDEEIVSDREIEIPGMEETVEKVAVVVVEPDANVEVMNHNNNQNKIGVQKEQTDSTIKQLIDLDGVGKPEIYNLNDANVARVDESMTDVTDKSEFVETKETESVDKAGWIVRRISELGGYENVSDSVKADVFRFDIADVSGSIRLFSDVMKRLGIKLDGDELFGEFQKVYDESVGRDASKDKAEDKMWNKGRGR